MKPRVEGFKVDWLRPHILSCNSFFMSVSFMLRLENAKSLREHKKGAAMESMGRIGGGTLRCRTPNIGA